MKTLRIVAILALSLGVAHAQTLFSNGVTDGGPRDNWPASYGWYIANQFTITSPAVISGAVVQLLTGDDRNIPERLSYALVGPDGHVLKTSRVILALAGEPHDGIVYTVWSMRIQAINERVGPGAYTLYVWDITARWPFWVREGDCVWYCDGSIPGWTGPVGSVTQSVIPIPPQAFAIEGR